jgi:hypothetical protein
MWPVNGVSAGVAMLAAGSVFAKFFLRKHVGPTRGGCWKARARRGEMMAQIDEVLAELRHRIMGPFESGPLKPAAQEVDEPINSEPSGGVVVGDDPVSPLIRRLSTDMPELMEEVVAFIERRTAELNADGGAAPRPTERVVPAALLEATPTPQTEDASKTAITLLLDTRVLASIDADAKRMGISRTAWLHVAADERLEGR